MTHRRHLTLRAAMLRLAPFALLAAAFAAPPVFAMSVEFAGRDGNGTLQFHAMDLTAGGVPSVITGPRVAPGGSFIIHVAPEPLSSGPLGVGPIFARARLVSAGAGTTALSTAADSSQSSRRLPSLVSHDVEVSEPPARSSGMGAGGVAVPLVQGMTRASSQSSAVVVTVEGTIDPGQPGAPPISNPLPGAVWLFATGLGLFPVLLKRCRRRLPRSDGSMG